MSNILTTLLITYGLAVVLPKYRFNGSFLCRTKKKKSNVMTRRDKSVNLEQKTYRAKQFLHIASLGGQYLNKWCCKSEYDH